MSSIRTCGLFEGIGGFSRAARRVGGFDWQCSVEIDDDAVRVLRDHFNHPIYHGDIRNFEPGPGQYDLLVGGFPCNGTSGAGKREGLHHVSSALFREFLRCICVARPALVLLEQPRGFEHRGLRAWIGGLNLAGYTSLNPMLVGADQLGAFHQRDRLFILSYSTEFGRTKQPSRWHNRVREVVERERNQAEWLSAQFTSDGITPRVSRELVPVSRIITKTRTPGRLKSRILAGRTVTVPQAAVALEWVKWLWEEIEKP